MTPEPVSGDRAPADTVVEVLAAHTMVSGFDEVGVYWKYACNCSWTGSSDADHHAHVAAAVLAAQPAPDQRQDAVDDGAPARDDQLESTREAFALGAAWAMGDDEEAPPALRARLGRVRALVESWPHGDNGQDYRRAVIQCRSAVLAALGEQP